MHDTIPSFTLRLDFKSPNGSFEMLHGIFTNSTHLLSASHQNMAHILEYRQQDDKIVLVLGSPIIDECIDRSKTAHAVLTTNNLPETVKTLNGEFLIVLADLNEKTLKVITDRYSSYPAFWAQNEQEFCLSYNYIDLAQHCVNWPSFKLRPEKAYEFFILQRLLGQETHDNTTLSIAPATILTVSPSHTPTSQRYWSPDYKKDTTSSKAELLEKFVYLFSKSVKIRSHNTKDNKNIGIFLSGGHDSRLVAAYTDPIATCYTLSFKKNLEVECAQKIAKTAGHDHNFCMLAPDFFEKTVRFSTYLSGALYATDHALFLSEGMTTPPQNHNIYLHGHGLDFMYQGMYLHARPLQFSKRDTYIKRFVPLPRQLAKHFIATIPFRSRYDISGICIKEVAHKYHNTLHALVQTIEETAKTLSDLPMDQWEYMVFHHPSRHYTFSNVLSKRTFGELRTPSFDNDLYDFYLSLPFKYRLHGDMLRGALFKKNAKIACIPAANHGLPAAWGPYAKTVATMVRKLLKHATLNTFFHPPQGKDRTWPDRDEYFRTHPAYHQQALSALNDKEFQSFLNFIDWNELDARKKSILDEPFGGVFLVTLLSYYEFYKAVMGNKK